MDAGGNKEIAIDGAIRKKLKIGVSTGRPQIHTVSTDTAGHTSYTQKKCASGWCKQRLPQILHENERLAESDIIIERKPVTHVYNAERLLVEDVSRN